MGILLQTFLSWLLLKYADKSGLYELGLRPDKGRLFNLLAGFLWPVAFYCVLRFSMSFFVHNPYRFNPDYTFCGFLDSLIYISKSVAFEELLFRGALLVILIKRLGPQKALILSSVAFGIYHWFSWQAFGNPPQMLIIFLSTGCAGYLFALAFQKTSSIYLPFGLHLGVNFSNMILFAGAENGKSGLLLKTFVIDPVIPAAVISIPLIILHYTGFQLFTFWGLYKLKRR